MKWLLTRGAKYGSSRAYEEWLARLSIQSTLVAPGRRAPGSLCSYSALLLTGGGDVNPALYNDAPCPETEDVDDFRDRTECELIATFLRERKPIFAVCRGLQILNVALRGKLIQHVPSVLRRCGGKASSEEHRKIAGRDSTHHVSFVEGTGLHAAFGPVLEVNSAHHQAADPDGLGNNLRVAATSPAGMVEAIEGVEPTQPVIAVQWHPERMPFEHPASSGLLRYMQELAARIGG